MNFHSPANTNSRQQTGGSLVCVAGEKSALLMFEVCVYHFCPSFLHRCPLIQFILHHCPSILPDNEPVCLPILSASNNVTHLAAQTEAHHRRHKYYHGYQCKYSFSTIHFETVIRKFICESFWSMTYQSVHEK